MRKPNAPDWWQRLEMPARLRRRLQSLFTITKDGYAVWYKGKARHAAARSVPPDQVEAAWEARRKAIDAAGDAEPAPAFRTCRSVFAEFLNVQKARVGAARNRIEDRTYHNYAKALSDFGNFRHDGAKVADADVKAISPAVFSAYARTFKGWKASGFDSVVCRVGACFRWAAEQEYVDRYRPGPEFVRPAKQDIRDERIDLAKSYTPAEVAALWHAAGPTARLWVALGVCAAFTNSDIGHLTRGVVDLDAGLIDFRRRKTGKVRRVIPLPPDVAGLLRAYRRPEPAKSEWADLFFLTERGNPYTRTRSRDGAYKPSDSVSRVFAKLIRAAGVAGTAGRNFTGLRTTHYNLCPVGYETERAVIMGRARGTIDLDHYAERADLDRLRHVVNHVWGQVRAEIDKAVPPNTSGPR